MHLATAMGLAVALPSMMAEFHADVGTAIWVQLAYSVALAGGTIPLGQSHLLCRSPRADPRGQPVDLVLMLVTAATGSIYVVIVARFLSALARTPPWLYLQLMAIGSYPPEQRGKVLGITRPGSGRGPRGGGPAHGLGHGSIGWRWLFSGRPSSGPCSPWRCGYSFPPTSQTPALAAPAGLGGVDLLGSLLLMVGVIGVVASLQTFAKGQASPLAIGAGALGGLALVAFVWQERRARAPILYLPLFGVRDIFLSAAQSLFLGFANGVVVLLLPFLFIKGYGWTAAYAGGVLLFLNLPRPAAGLLGGWLADRYGSLRTIAPAALVILVGQLGAALLGVDPPLALLVGALLLLGLGDTVATTANLRQIFSAMPRAYLSLAPGTNLVLSLLGATAGQAFVAAALEVAGVSATSRAAIQPSSASPRRCC